MRKAISRRGKVTHYVTICTATVRDTKPRVDVYITLIGQFASPADSARRQLHGRTQPAILQGVATPSFPLPNSFLPSHLHSTLHFLTTHAPSTLPVPYPRLLRYPFASYDVRSEKGTGLFCSYNPGSGMLPSVLNDAYVQC